MKTLSIKSFEDIQEFCDSLFLFFEIKGFPASSFFSLEFKVTEEVFDKIARYLRNRNLTTIDLKYYSEYSFVIKGIRIKLKL